MLTWKTHNDGKKPRQSTNCRIHYMGKEYNRESTRGNDLLHFSLRHTRRLQWRQLPLSLSHSPSLSVQLTLYKSNSTTTTTLHTESMCPKSYLYIYDFSAYLHMCPSQSVGTSSEISPFSISSIRRDLFPNTFYRGPLPPFLDQGREGITKWDKYPSYFLMYNFP